MNTIIFNSEVEFRNYVIKHSKEVSNVMILEDKLDKVIYFYSFINNNLIIASKETSEKSFEYYNNKYQKLKKALKLNIDYVTDNPKMLKLTK